MWGDASSYFLALGGSFEGSASTLSWVLNGAVTAARGRRRCCCSIWTGSRPTTTPSGISPAVTPCSSPTSHERWDGSGYPDGLRGKQIPLGARIVSACDAYEAMTASPPYSEPMSGDAACRELRDAAGTQFDPAVVDAFLLVLRCGSGGHRRDAARDAAAHIETLLAHPAPS